MKILVVIPHTIVDMGYMRSQVVAQFGFLASTTYDVAILSVGNILSDKIVRFSSDLRNLKIIPYIINSFRHPAFTYINCSFRASAFIREFKPDVIYSREVWGALVASRALKLSGRRGVKLIYDVRGAVPEEIALATPGWIGAVKNHLFTLLERMAINNATSLNAVTKELSDHIFRKYGRRADTIIPCCVEGIPPFDNVARELSRKNFGFDKNHTVYVYSGGLSHWQLFGETLDLFSRIAEVDASARLLVITPEKERAFVLLSIKLPTERYKLVSVQQDGVNACLQAADVGFLLRDNNVVNRVAFPIKFAEYLAAGLPVIASKGVAEIASIIMSEGLGLVVSLQGAQERSIAAWAREVATFRDEWRTRTRAYVATHLVWNEYLDSYAVLYGEPQHNSVIPYDEPWSNVI